MTNDEHLKAFYIEVKKSIEKGTFSKLTLAKTIGNQELMNIYVRAIVKNEKLALELKFKFWHEEKTEIYSIDEAFSNLTSYFGNPFQSMLLFTCENDVTLKINKKRDYKITQQPPTFKHAADVIKAYYSK